MSNNPTKTTEWKALEGHKRNITSTSLQNLFSEDSDRFNTLSTKIEGLFFDYSKQKVTPQTIEKLCDLARTCRIEEKRDNMFSGKTMNTTENRAALHTALRRPVSDEVIVNNKNIIPDIHENLEKMKKFSNDVRDKKYKGATGQHITNIVCLGVGGSDLGPRMAVEALKTKEPSPLNIHFVSNIDEHDIRNTLAPLNAEQTLFIVTSKSWGTKETLGNAAFAKNWLIENSPKNTDIAPHFIGISDDKQAVLDWGISEDNYFPVAEWVNGRFSLWSSVGLSICLQCGFDVFQQLLDGAYAMDQHFLNTDLEKNIPVLMALIGIWNRNFLDCNTLATLPYAEKLFYLPAYFQQLEMESNGKSTTLDQELITDYETAPILFGEIGTNGQHSFYQLLHQGSDIIPCDFIGIKEETDTSASSNSKLLNNMLAQSQALMQGRTVENASENHRHFDGNRPSSTILLERLDAFHLGLLISLYEHKCFVQGAIWHINSFDQFGVELGKTLSHKLDHGDLSDVDPSTAGLISIIHKTSK